MASVQNKISRLYKNTIVYINYCMERNSRSRKIAKLHKKSLILTIKNFLQSGMWYT